MDVNEHERQSNSKLDT